MPVSFDALSRHFVEVNLGEQQHGATREQIMARLDEMSAKLERILLEYRERYGTTGGLSTFGNSLRMRHCAVLRRYCND